MGTFRETLQKITDRKRRIKRQDRQKAPKPSKKVVTPQRRAQLQAAVTKYHRANRPLQREIGLYEVQIDWERRLRCKTSLQSFCETYLQAVFYHQWSSDQLICLEKAQAVCYEGGK